MNNVPGTSQAWCDDVIVAARPTFMTFYDSMKGMDQRTDGKRENCFLPFWKVRLKRIFLLRNVFEISSFFNFGFRWNIFLIKWAKRNLHPRFCSVSQKLLNSLFFNFSYLQIYFCVSFHPSNKSPIGEKTFGWMSKKSTPGPLWGKLVA